MKYLKLATYDFGGAGLAAQTSVTKLNEMGIDAKLLVLYKTGSNSNVIGVFCKSRILQRFAHKFYYILINIYKKILAPKVESRYCFYDFQISAVSAKKILSLYGDIPDVIDVYWVSNFLSFKTISQLKQMTNAKVIFTMADNAHMTGGCHYPWQCEGYYRGCYPCPALFNKSVLARQIFNKKKKYLPENSILIGATGDCKRASNSELFKKSLVMSVVDIPDISGMYDRATCRDHWNISQDDYVIFFGALNVEDKRKGFVYLVEALQKFSRCYKGNKSVTLLVAGNISSIGDFGFNVVSTGRLPMDELMKAFACADLYISPSVEDSGPMMVNYAFKANIPVVAFKIGVALDLVDHRVNGWLSPVFDTDDMQLGISYCLENIDKSSLEAINNLIFQEISENKNFYKIIESL